MLISLVQGLVLGSKKPARGVRVSGLSGIWLRGT
jgi:hypothetical protein